jgi:regulator of protease activity HflC (stomatin/prohibitin superfamily)
MEILFDELAIFVIVFLALAVLIIFMGVKQVPQGEEYTVERFGRYTKTLKPGLNLIVPFVDRIGSRLNMREQVLDVMSQEVITKDNAMVTADGVVFFQVVDAAQAAYEVNDLERAVLNLTMTNIRTVMGSMDLDMVLSERDTINASLLKMKAEREKRANILDAEGERQSEILRAEGRKQAAILEAEGRREAAFRDAEAREREAEAEGKATAMVSAAIAKGDIQAVNYFVAQQYVDALAQFAKAPNQKVFFMPVEASGVIGAIGGITEIARQAFNDGGHGGNGADPGSGGSGPRRPPSPPASPTTANAGPWDRT